MNIHYLKYLLCLLAVSVDAVELTCNDDQVVEIESTVILECTSPGSSIIYYYTPSGKEGARCQLDVHCRSNDIRYDATLINEHTIHLNITSVQVPDGGLWRCKDAFTNEESTCTLEVTETPSCDINSYRNTDALELNEEITLTVNINDYYCARPFDFRLQTGGMTEILVRNLQVNAVQSIITGSTFKMSESRNGSLELLFNCHNKRIRCSGVDTLILRPLPTCNITSDSEFSGLRIGEDITLYVYIEGYQCSSTSGYLLYTGDVMNTLNQSDNGMFEGNTTITLTSSHFGNVYVGFTCNGASRNIICDGIATLDERESTTILTTIRGSTTGNIEDRPALFLNLGIGIGIGIGIGVAITLMIVGMCIMVKRKGPCLKDGVKPSPSDTIRADQSEPQTRPTSVPQNGGGEHEMPRTNYDNLHRTVDTANSYERLTLYETIEHDT